MIDWKGTVFPPGRPRFFSRFPFAWQRVSTVRRSQIVAAPQTLEGPAGGRSIQESILESKDSRGNQLFLDFVGGTSQFTFLFEQRFRFSDRVEHRGVIAAAKIVADLVHALGRQSASQQHR